MFSESRTSASSFLSLRTIHFNRKTVQEWLLKKLQFQNWKSETVHRKFIIPSCKNTPAASYNHALCRDDIEIFIDQDPEIRKTGQCTKSTSCWIIGNTYFYGRICAIVSPVKNAQSCWAVESARLINHKNRFLDRMLQVYTWGKISAT